MNPWTYAKAGCSEHASQVALFMWANMAYSYGVQAADDPRAYGDEAYANAMLNISPKRLLELRWLFAIPNGGERSGNAGAVMRSEGQKPGVADIFLPIPKVYQIGYHGLFIEMKKEIYRKQKDGGLSIKQLDFKFDMVTNGYAAVVCYSWLEARNAIMQYLGLENVAKGFQEIQKI